MLAVVTGNTSCPIPKENIHSSTLSTDGGAAARFSPFTAIGFIDLTRVDREFEPQHTHITSPSTDHLDNWILSFGIRRSG